MKQQKNKRALLMSALSLLLCVSMLVGSTFAWFTDSVTSGRNNIQSGNLDIKLEYRVQEDGVWSDWAEVTSTTDIFSYDKWEPGYVAVAQFRITNQGSLALKYQLAADIYEEVAGKTQAGETFLLSDYIKTAIVDADATRDEILAMEGTPFKVSYGMSTGSLAAAAPGATSTAEVTMAIWMPTTVGNEANHDGTNVPSISFGINLLATQDTVEADSFDNQYDADATYIPAWDGTTVETPDVDAAGVYQIDSAEELAGFAQLVMGGKKNAKGVLNADIDLGGNAWTPIVTTINEPGYSGTFDGQGHTVYNLNVYNMVSYGCGGLFGYVTGTVKNVTVENAVVRSTYDAGAVAGYAYGDILNCAAVNCSISANQAGGITGLIASADVQGCRVENCNVIGANGAGGLVGITMDKNTNVIYNVVKNTNIMAKSANEEVYWHAATGDSSVANNTLEGNTVTSYGLKLTLVSNAEQLLALGGTSAEGVIALTDDIDLAGAAMPTIGAAYGKSLTVLGNGYTISNAKTAHTNHNGMKHHGLFYAYTNSTLEISNLVIENVNIDATADTERNYGAGVVLAYADGGSNVTLTNVDVINCSVLNNTADIGDEAGVYVGYQTGTLTMVDCDSTGCTVAGETTEKTGAFIGMVNGTATLTNCTTDLTIGVCNRVGGTLTVN